MNDTEKNKTNSSAPESEAHAKARAADRRRLLKAGVFGVPTILTVHASQVFANGWGAPYGYASVPTQPATP